LPRINNLTEPSQDWATDGPADAGRICPDPATAQSQRVHNDSAAASDAAGPSGEVTAHPDEVTPQARLLRIHPAYLGLSLRLVARVANYRGWADLVGRYNLGQDIAEAKALAARAQHLLYLNPVNPEHLYLHFDPTAVSMAGAVGSDSRGGTPPAHGGHPTAVSMAGAVGPTSPERPDVATNVEHSRRDWMPITNDLGVLNGLTLELTVQSQAEARATVHCACQRGPHSGTRRHRDAPIARYVTPRIACDRSLENLASLHNNSRSGTNETFVATEACQISSEDSS
jgi:hypothetical protein